MPRKKKTAKHGDSALGAALAPMIREIVREEIGQLMRGIARQYGTPEPETATPDVPKSERTERPENGSSKHAKRTETTA